MIATRPPIFSRLRGGAYRFATCWAVERTDGVVVRVTNHNSTLHVVQGDNTYIYKAAAGFLSSARDKPANFQERNVEVSGFFSTNYITEEDLRADRYNDARITELVVDWLCPWAGFISVLVFYIREITWTGEVWKAQLDGLTSRIRRPIGNVYSRTCQWDLGQSFGTARPGCHINLASFTDSGAVDTVTTQRRSFKTDLSQVDGYYSRGILEWTSGENNGLRFEVQTSYNTDGKLVLFLDTPFDIEPGDTFDVSAGCDKLLGTCLTKFNNVANFGGHPTIPGTDRMISVPVAP